MDVDKQDLIGVILAAGRGSRMGPLQTGLPKPVLPILDRPIVHHQLEIMRSLGIAKAVIVVGHRGYELVRQLERLPITGIETEYVEQEETLGIAHCVGRLEGIVHQPFLLFLGDIYFRAPNIGEMLDVFQEPETTAVLGAIEEADPGMIAKNFCIMTDASGRATHVIEKPRYPQSRLKGVGLYLFSPVVFDAIRRTPRTAMRDEYEITDSIQIMINDGHLVRVSTAVEEDLNITSPADLLKANLSVLAHEGMDRYVADSAQIADGAVVAQAVVGARARIGAGATVRRSVVFADTAVPAGARLEDCIVTEAGIQRL